MVVAKGYKQTEVGVIPEDWEVMSIDEVFDFYSTANFSKAQMKFDGEVGCLHYGLIHAIPNSSYNLQNGVKYFVDKKQTKYELLKEGDVIMVDASEDLLGVNKSVEISGVGDALFIAGLHTFLLRDKGFYQPNFRGAILNSYLTKSQMLRLAVGMKVFGVSKPQLKTILLPLPPLHEQTAIANALSDMDALIAQTEKLIEKKKAIKQGVMQELLKPKEGWVTKKLGEVCEIKKGQLITDSTRVNGDIPVIAGGKTPAYYHNKANRTGNIITISGSGANAGYVSFYEHPIFASDCSTISNSDKYNVEFIFYWFQLNQSLVYSLQTGGAQPHIHPSDLNPLEIFIPSIEIQNQIATIFRELQKELNKLETKLQKLKNQKQGMMQALLTGKIRLV